MSYGPGVDYRPRENRVQYSYGRLQPQETRGDLSVLDEIPAYAKSGQNAYPYQTTPEGAILFRRLLGFKSGEVATSRHPLFNIKFRWFTYRTLHATADALTFFSQHPEHRPPVLTMKDGGTASWFDAMLFQAFGGSQVKTVIELWGRLRDQQPPAKPPTTEPAKPVPDVGGEFEELRDEIAAKIADVDGDVARLMNRLDDVASKVDRILELVEGANG